MMTPFNSTLLIIFGIVMYIMIIDKNVEDYLFLVFKIMKVNVERAYWMIRFHPKNPITNLIMKWKYEQIAKELEKEFNFPKDS